MSRVLCVREAAHPPADAGLPALNHHIPAHMRLLRLNVLNKITVAWCQRLTVPNGHDLNLLMLTTALVMKLLLILATFIAPTQVSAADTRKFASLHIR